MQLWPIFTNEEGDDGGGVLAATAKVRVIAAPVLQLIANIACKKGSKKRTVVP